MAIKVRITLKPYPGAITEVEVPFECDKFPSIQELALFLMSSEVAKPSVIIQGKIYTEELASVIEFTHCPLI